MPSQPVDFYQAGQRHFHDAELLHDHARNAAAGQLYGFTAECGIKFLLLKQGYPSDPATGELVEDRKKRKFKKHIHELVSNINHLHAYLDGRGAAQYLAMMPSLMNFADWTTAYRYYNESHIPLSLTEWRSASREVMLMLDQLLLDMP
jgi:hypothetical protein